MCIGIKCFSRSGYPDMLLYKLYERRGKCNLSLRNYSAARDDVSLALKYLTTSNLSEEKQAVKKKELMKVASLMERELEKNGVAAGGGDTADTGDPVLALAAPHPGFPQLSEAVTIRYAASRGRYAVAARDIRVGELIAVEEAFVAVLDREQRLTNCWHCLQCAQRPLPCPGCSGLVFCSTACRDAALASYHPAECGYTDLLYQAQLGAWLLGYRVLTSRPWAHYRDTLHTWLQRDERRGAGGGQGEGEGVYTSGDLLSFHSLVTHDGAGGKNAPELMMQCHVVVFLLRLLQEVGWLPADPGLGAELGEEAVLAGRLLHHFMRAAYYNTHETTQLLTSPGQGQDFTRSSAQRIGRLTNPSLALINHSCDPNYRRVSRGTVTYGFACKPIGELITN